jgi:hypothetical protein
VGEYVFTVGASRLIDRTMAKSHPDWKVGWFFRFEAAPELLVFPEGTLWNVTDLAECAPKRVPRMAASYTPIVPASLDLWLSSGKVLLFRR